MLQHIKFGRYPFTFAPDTGGAGGGTKGDAGSNQSKDANGQGTDIDGDQDSGTEQVTYEDWIKTQPETVKSLLEQHTTGLRSALQNERQTAKEREKQIRTLSSQAEKGSQLETDLNKIADDLAKADQRAEFYEDAHTAGITNLRLAWMVAQQDGLFDRKGNADFTALKRDYPELFGRTKAATGSTRVSANGGETNDGATGGNMNAFIRQSAGRG